MISLKEISSESYFPLPPFFFRRMAEYFNRKDEVFVPPLQLLMMSPVIRAELYRDHFRQNGSRGIFPDFFGILNKYGPDELRTFIFAHPAMQCNVREQLELWIVSCARQKYAEILFPGKPVLCAAAGFSNLAEILFHAIHPDQLFPDDAETDADAERQVGSFCSCMILEEWNFPQEISRCLKEKNQELEKIKQIPEEILEEIKSGIMCFDPYRSGIQLKLQC